jgi:hypothetical protein
MLRRTAKSLRARAMKPRLPVTQFVRHDARAKNLKNMKSEDLPRGFVGVGKLGWLGSCLCSHWQSS